MAKVLLASAEMDEGKREQVGKWLVAHETDIDKQEEEEREKETRAEEASAAASAVAAEPEHLVLKPIATEAAATATGPKSPRPTIMGQGRTARTASSANAAEEAGTKSAPKQELDEPRHLGSVAVTAGRKDSDASDPSVRMRVLAKPLPVPNRTSGGTSATTLSASPSSRTGSVSGPSSGNASKTSSVGRSAGGPLSANDSSLLRSHPNKSFAVMIERGAFLPANAFVEVVCRSAAVWVVKVPGIAKQCYHVPPEKLCPVQEAPSGIPWVLAEVEGRVKHEGKGPELSFDVGQTIWVLKMTSHFWQGILPDCGDIAIFDCTLVRLLRVTSPEMDLFAKLLASALASGGEGHPDEALRSAVVAAGRSRGNDEVTGIHVQVFNQCRAPDSLPVCINNVKLSFSLNAVGARVDHEIKFSCPESEVSSFGLWRARVLPPNVGRALMNKVTFHFEPPEIELSSEEPQASIRISAALKPNVQLDEMQSLVLPIVLTSVRGALRFFLICDIVSVQLKRQSMFVPKKGLDESWETMHVSQFEGSGMRDLLSDLVSFPKASDQ